MWLKNEKLEKFLFLSFLATIILPLVHIFIVLPAFERLQIRHFEDSALRLSAHMESELNDILEVESGMEKDHLTEYIVMRLDRYTADFQLEKIKYFSETGLTIYSTEIKDIGKVNNNSYFHEIVAAGEIYSKVVKKETASLENQKYEEDVVEIYVPLERNGQFYAAFEIYYNITANLKELNSLMYLSTYFPLFVLVLLLTLLFWGGFRLDQSLTAKERAEKQVETLHGIIPICMYCKGIRDDAGAWNRLETYLEEHSEAEFSHGICEKCMKEHFGDSKS